jgi:parvulin-like peptidyl-prolyl isomerase
LRNRELWLIIVGLILLNCLTAIYFLFKSPSKEAVATIGGRSISRQEWLNELEARYGKDVLKDMIDQQVIKAMAAKFKVTVSDKEVDQEYRMTQASYGFPGQNKDVDPEKWKEQIRNSLLLEKIFTKDVVVTEQEMQEYYQKNKSQFNVPTVYHLSHIVVKTDNEANKALKELSQGSSFSALAMERSIDEFSANQGGDIGYVSEGDEQYPASYLQIAKNLEPNKWSKPIKVNDGYAIIQLHKIIKGKSYSYHEVKAQIRRQIAMEQMNIPASARTFWNDAKVSWFYDK